MFIRFLVFPLFELYNKKDNKYLQTSSRHKILEAEASRNVNNYFLVYFCIVYVSILSRITFSLSSQNSELANKLYPVEFGPKIIGGFERTTDRYVQKYIRNDSKNNNVFSQVMKNFNLRREM